MGMTLQDKLNEIYKEYGYYCDALDSFTLKGKDGIEKIQQVMKELRENTNVSGKVSQVIDYLGDEVPEDGFGKLPKADVIKYILKDGSWIAVRPSGTEPKIKIYYSIQAEKMYLAEEKLKKIQNSVRDFIEK